MTILFKVTIPSFQIHFVQQKQNAQMAAVMMQQVNFFGVSDFKVKLYNVSDFKVKFLQRVRFFCKIFTMRQILHAMKKLKRQIWMTFLLLKRQVFTHFTPIKRQTLHLRYITKKTGSEAKIFTSCQILK